MLGGQTATQFGRQEAGSFAVASRGRPYQFGQPFADETRLRRNTLAGVRGFLPTAHCVPRIDKHLLICKSPVVLLI
jgi:hypothetical protein